MEAWDRIEQDRYFNPAIMNGAIPICDLGCGLLQWLVVHGEQKGHVWDDFRADHRGIRPRRDHAGRQMTFSDWYMSWLEGSLRTLGFEQAVVSLLVRGERLRAIQFYQEEEGIDPKQAERAVEAIAVRHRVATQTSRSREMLTLLGLIVAGVLLGLAMALLRE